MGFGDFFFLEKGLGKFFFLNHYFTGFGFLVLEFLRLK